MSQSVSVSLSCNSVVYRTLISKHIIPQRRVETCFRFSTLPASTIICLFICLFCTFKVKVKGNVISKAENKNEHKNKESMKIKERMRSNNKTRDYN